MLPRANRLVRAEDFRSTVRRGRRYTAPHFVIFSHFTGENSPPRFGLITNRAVGNAVNRNTVRRRLRAVAIGLLDDANRGTAIVIRALPGAAELSWQNLVAEVVPAISQSYVVR